MKYMLFLLTGFAWVSCSPNNVQIDNTLGNYFKQNHVEGCFALLNNNSGDFTIFNLNRYKDSAFLPASTFKIVNALIGLQTGIISSDTMIIKWDGIVRNIPEWNKDLRMKEAFRLSAVPYFQEVARRIGRLAMQRWLDTIAYGTKKILGPIDSFWLNNSLKITPDEELGLVKKLYFNQLPFNRFNQEVVKRAMVFDDKTAFRLSYKTGMGFKENGNLLGWVVGYIEENKHPYFFVLNIESKQNEASFGELRIKILKAILAHLGFMNGKK